MPNEERWICRMSGNPKTFDQHLIDAIDKLFVLKYGADNVRWVESNGSKWDELQIRAGIYGNEVIG